jgi:hypothetical protein
LGPPNEEGTIHDDSEKAESPPTDRMAEKILIREWQVLVAKIVREAVLPPFDEVVVKGYEFGSRRNRA